MPGADEGQAFLSDMQSARAAAADGEDIAALQQQAELAKGGPPDAEISVLRTLGEKLAEALERESKARSEQSTMLYQKVFALELQEEEMADMKEDLAKEVARADAAAERAQKLEADCERLQALVSGDSASAPETELEDMRARLREAELGSEEVLRRGIELEQTSREEMACLRSQAREAEARTEEVEHRAAEEGAALRLQLRLAEEQCQAAEERAAEAEERLRRGVEEAAQAAELCSQEVLRRGIELEQTSREEMAHLRSQAREAEARTEEAERRAAEEVAALREQLRLAEEQCQAAEERAAEAERTFSAVRHGVNEAALREQLQLAEGRCAAAEERLAAETDSLRRQLQEATDRLAEANQLQQAERTFATPVLAACSSTSRSPSPKGEGVRFSVEPTSGGDMASTLPAEVDLTTTKLHVTGSEISEEFTKSMAELQAEEDRLALRLPELERTVEEKEEELRKMADDGESLRSELAELRTQSAERQQESEEVLAAERSASESRIENLREELGRLEQVEERAVAAAQETERRCSSVQELYESARQEAESAREALGRRGRTEPPPPADEEDEGAEEVAAYFATTAEWTAPAGGDESAGDAALQRLEAELRGRDDALAAERHNAEEARAALETAGAELQRLETELRERDGALAAARHDAEEARAALERGSQSVDDASTELRAELERLEAELRERDGALAAARHDAGEARAALERSTADDDRAELRAELERLEAAASGSDAERQRLEAGLRERDDALAAAASQAAETRDALASATAEADALRAELSRAAAASPPQAASPPRTATVAGECAGVSVRTLIKAIEQVEKGNGQSGAGADVHQPHVAGGEREREVAGDLAAEEEAELHAFLQATNGGRDGDESALPVADGLAEQLPDEERQTLIEQVWEMESQKMAAERQAGALRARMAELQASYEAAAESEERLRRRAEEAAQAAASHGSAAEELRREFAAMSEAAAESDRKQERSGAALAAEQEARRAAEAAATDALERAQDAANAAELAAEQLAGRAAERAVQEMRAVHAGELKAAEDRAAALEAALATATSDADGLRARLEDAAPSGPPPEQQWMAEELERLRQRAEGDDDRRRLAEEQEDRLRQLADREDEQRRLAEEREAELQASRADLQSCTEELQQLRSAASRVPALEAELGERDARLRDLEAAAAGMATGSRSRRTRTVSSSAPSDPPPPLDAEPGSYADYYAQAEAMLRAPASPVPPRSAEKGKPPVPRYSLSPSSSARVGAEGSELLRALRGLTQRVRARERRGRDLRDALRAAARAEQEAQAVRVRRGTDAVAAEAQRALELEKAVTELRQQLNSRVADLADSQQLCSEQEEHALAELKSMRSRLDETESALVAAEQSRRREATDASARFTELTQQLAQAEAGRASAREALRLKVREQEAAERSARMLKVELESATAELQSLGDGSSEAERQLRVARDDKRRLQERVTEAERRQRESKDHCDQAVGAATEAREVAERAAEILRKQKAAVAADLSQTQRELEAESRDLSHARSLLSDKEEQAAAMTARVGGLVEELKAAKDAASAAAALQESVQQLERRLKEEEDAAAALRGEKAEASVAVDSANREAASATLRLQTEIQVREGVEAERDRLRSKADGLQRTCDSLTDSLRGAEEARQMAEQRQGQDADILHREVLEWQSKHSALEAEVTQLIRARATLEARYRTLEQESERMRGTVERANQGAQQERSRVEQIQSEMRQQLTAAAEEAARAQRKVASAKTEADAALTARDESEEECARLRQHLEEVRALAETREGEAVASRQQLERQLSAAKDLSSALEQQKQALERRHTDTVRENAAQQETIANLGRELSAQQQLTTDAEDARRAQQRRADQCAADLDEVLARQADAGLAADSVEAALALRAARGELTPGPRTGSHRPPGMGDLMATPPPRLSMSPSPRGGDGHGSEALWRQRCAELSRTCTRLEEEAAQREEQHEEVQTQWFAEKAFLCTEVEELESRLQGAGRHEGTRADGRHGSDHLARLAGDAGSTSVYSGEPQHPPALLKLLTDEDARLRAGVIPCDDLLSVHTQVSDRLKRSAVALRERALAAADLPRPPREDRAARQRDKAFRTHVGCLTDDAFLAEAVAEKAKESSEWVSRRVCDTMVYNRSFAFHLTAARPGDPGNVEPWNDPICRALVNDHRGRWCAALAQLAEELEEEVAVMERIDESCAEWLEIDLGDRALVAATVDRINATAAEGERELISGRRAGSALMEERSGSRDTEAWPPSAAELSEQRLANEVRTSDEARARAVQLEREVAALRRGGRSAPSRDEARLRSEVRRLHKELKAARAVRRGSASPGSTVQGASMSQQEDDSDMMLADEIAEGVLARLETGSSDSSAS